MMGVRIPSDPVPTGYVPNPYGAQIKAALGYLRREKESSEGWQIIDIKDGIIMEKKSPAGDSSSIPAVRARGIIRNMSPGALLSTISQTSARQYWDKRYIPGGLLERYDRRTHKSYSAQKGAGVFVSERDIVGVQTVVFPNGLLEGGFEIVQTSVEGDEENSGRVRAKVTCAGWVVVPRGEDLEVVYVMKIDPNGSIPSPVVSRIVQGMPRTVINTTNFIRNTGYPPYISSPSFASQLRTETFTLGTRTHRIRFIAGNQDEEISVTVDPRPFGGNWRVGAFGMGAAARKKDNATAVVRVPAGSGKFEVVISAA
ncbi:Bet v1-like protein [Ceratobasidium sp. AG-I]|nr:Bet v1-like protein [Ceratobasidium sp. AG-I]